MAITKRRYGKEEFARRGDTIYEQRIRPLLRKADEGKFLAIDIESGTYELHLDEQKAGDKLRSRVPEAQIWMMRVGYQTVRSFGGRGRKQKPA